MLHIVTQSNRHLYVRQLDDMHRQRCELFVKAKGWNLTVRNEREYDDGDDDQAVYLLGVDETGFCHSSIRVRPAHDFSYVLDAMREWVQEDPKVLRQDPGLWEMARWISQGADRGFGDEIRIGMIEYLLTRGATQCIACGDLDVTAYGIRAGWRVNFLGVPRRYPEGGVAVATSLPISAEEIAYLRDLTARRDPFIMEIPADAPWARLPLATIEAAYRRAAESVGHHSELGALADQILQADMAAGRAA